MHTHTRTHTHTYTQTLPLSRKHKHTHTYIHQQALLRSSVRALQRASHSLSYAHKHRHSHAQTLTHAHTHTHTYTHPHSLSHTHTHTSKRSCAPQFARCNAQSQIFRASNYYRHCRCVAECCSVLQCVLVHCVCVSQGVFQYLLRGVCCT